MKVALFSGGKDSHLAVIKEWPVDALVFLVYSFPEPSPHIENLNGVAEAAGCMGLPLLVYRVPRRGPREATARFLKAIGATTIVAGDVYIEDHLRYMESLAAEAGARLREPLWGADPEELVYEAIEYGVRALVIGTRGDAKGILGATLAPETMDFIVDALKSRGLDPLGENGEYHTIVTSSPLYRGSLQYKVAAERAWGPVNLIYLRVTSSC